MRSLGLLCSGGIGGLGSCGSAPQCVLVLVAGVCLEMCNVSVSGFCVFDERSLETGALVLQLKNLVHDSVLKWSPNRSKRRPKRLKDVTKTNSAR